MPQQKMVEFGGGMELISIGPRCMKCIYRDLCTVEKKPTNLFQSINSFEKLLQ